MKIARSENIPSSEITPESEYFSRRRFLKELGLVAGGAAFLAACGPLGILPKTTEPTSKPGNIFPPTIAEADELGGKLTSYKTISDYNNFYEFLPYKTGVEILSSKFITSPWEIKVGGMVRKPRTYALEDILSKITQEERIYRLRCVEAWSMVIPWDGFSLSKILNEVEPTSGAKYVRFESVLRPDQMPMQTDPRYKWPYVEGLRLDEAMHDLTILATGIYGKPLTTQSGAPVRLVVPWKYGFKSIKSIVKIDLVSEMPVSFWMNEAADEYGFYANVNPEVRHPRWSQSTERRIEGDVSLPTLKFNGYDKKVGGLYTGMDLATWY
jgi:methionine sulfoxide reductase catalytic subunit